MKYSIALATSLALACTSLQANEPTPSDLSSLLVRDITQAKLLHRQHPKYPVSAAKKLGYLELYR